MNESSHDATAGATQLLEQVQGRQRETASLFLIVLGLVVVPLLYLTENIDIVQVNMLGRYLCFAIVAVSLDLIWGYTGLLCLCQSMFFALGGYAMGMYLAHHGGPEGIVDASGWKIPACLYVVYPGAIGETENDWVVPFFWKPFYWLEFTAILGLVIPGLVAAVVGFFVFRSRVRGVFFAILTQALTLAVWLVFSMNKMKLCGTNGLTRFEHVGPFFDPQQGGSMSKLVILMTLLVGVNLFLFSRAIANWFRIGRETEQVRFWKNPPRLAMLVFSLLAALGSALWIKGYLINNVEDLDELRDPSVKFSLYLLTVVLLLDVYLLCRYITQSRMGRVLIAIRDKESRLRFSGYRPYVYKVFIFSVSAMLAGLGGMLYAPQMGIFTPTNLEPKESILVVIWVAVGGRGSLSGPIIGALGVNLIYSYLTGSAPETWPFLQGALFVAVVLARPDGLISLKQDYSWYRIALNRFHDYSGRAARPEFWYFVVHCLVFVLLLIAAVMLVAPDGFTQIFSPGDLGGRGSESNMGGNPMWPGQITKEIGRWSTPMQVVLGVVAMAIATVIGAALLRRVCRFVNRELAGFVLHHAVPSPPFGKAQGIALLCFLTLAVIVGLWLQLAPGLVGDHSAQSIMFLMVWILSALLIPAMIMQWLLPTTYPRALLVTFVWDIVCFLLYIVFIDIAMFGHVIYSMFIAGGDRELIISLMGWSLWCFILVMLIPLIPLSVRRLHDSGLSARWLLVAILPLTARFLLPMCGVELGSGMNFVVFLGVLQLLFLMGRRGVSESNQYGPALLATAPEGRDPEDSAGENDGQDVKTLDLEKRLRRVANIQRLQGIKPKIKSEILSVHDLTVVFDGFKALDIDEFHLPHYMLQVIIGPNGAGKTTLCDVISGKTRPTTGRIIFNGQEITEASEAEIALLGVGRKFQTPTIYDSLTVYQNMELALPDSQRLSRNLLLRTTQEQHHRIYQMLRRVRLDDDATRLVKYLSHGQRQWLEISMLILSDPELLLVDEPAAGLTDEETVLTAELLLELQEDHSIVVIEHDMEFVRLLNAPVVVLNEGLIMASGSMAEVQADERVVEAYLGR